MELAKNLSVDFGVVLFPDPKAKKLVLFVLLGISTFYMVGSNLGFLNLIELDRSPSHFLENHTTQSIFFSIASAFCGFLITRSGSWWLKVSFLVLFVGFIFNIFFVSTGRGGLVFFTVLMSVCMFFYLRKYRTRLVITFSGFAVCLGYIGDCRPVI